MKRSNRVLAFTLILALLSIPALAGPAESSEGLDSQAREDWSGGPGAEAADRPGDPGRVSMARDIDTPPTRVHTAAEVVSEDAFCVINQSIVTSGGAVCCELAELVCSQGCPCGVQSFTCNSDTCVRSCKCQLCPP